MDDVVTRLEGEGHTRGIHTLCTAASLGGTRCEVVDGEDAQACRRNHDAGGHGRVDEGHAVARQRRGVEARIVVAHVVRVLGGGAERLDKRYALVIEAQLKRLARAAIGHGKERD